MVPSTHALFETFSPIFIVDGYIRYRQKRIHPDAEPESLVAVLSTDRRVLGEWPLREWPKSIGDRYEWPVLVEFSQYGGIHRIDGRPTGVLPTEISPFGIGVAADDKRRGGGGVFRA
ncbi:MAG: hypothetical protein JOY59_13980 [Candidatus Eremiobacteraeota bacterium]|nr:hypothetical protein [Candidatus Eremiobacteraeota bacterium]